MARSILREMRDKGTIKIVGDFHSKMFIYTGVNVSAEVKVE